MRKDNIFARTACFAYNTRMEIEDLRKIGGKLLREIADVRRLPDIRVSLGIGAGGDKTFPIDKKAEEIIISELETLRLPLTIISEEAGIIHVRGGGIRVVIDPIDGSKNAISGIPFYCSSIAVADGDRIGDIDTAYIINLVSGDEFWAMRDAGSFLNGERIHTQKDAEFSLMAYEAQTPEKDISQIAPLLSRARKTRCLGATALDLSYLACGAISVFVSASPSRSFDFAGGWLVAKEAEGIVTDTEGGDVSNVTLGLGRSSPLLAAGNPALHQRALEILSKKR
jgi:myo-inositol-1(or 4)-monophosphatase